MQCEIRGMGDMAEAARTTDTLPKPGRVNEVCREWLVKEDGALAYRLQTEEIQQHYTGNRSRNAQVREDFPQAVHEQQKEQEEAAALQEMYSQILREQEEIDAHVASQLAHRLEQEERDHQIMLEEKDKEIARRLQEKEKLRLERVGKSPTEGAAAAAAMPRSPVEQLMPQYNPDMNSVGLPLPPEYSQPFVRPDALCQQMRSCSVSERRTSHQSADDLYSLPSDSLEGPSSRAFSEEEARRLQEEKDAEYARMLQEQEGQSELSMLDQDRLIAIEAQDKELARLLQERERAKAKRARERAKQKALLKKQQQQQQQQPETLSDDEGFAASPPALPSPYSPEEGHSQSPPHAPAVRPTELDLSNPRAARVKPKYIDPEAIEVLPSVSPEPGPSHVMPNIAMAIDPTYPRRAASHSHCTDTPLSSVSSPAISLPPPDFEAEEGPVPPYMPIQGQRRSASLEKKSKKSKSKKEGKDSCKQQ